MLSLTTAPLVPSGARGFFFVPVLRVQGGL
ncbi:hypothetical protein [Klebsiella phage pKP-M212-2.1]|nr:hypothetical protein [Klebsiella phage pKP-M212-2.1]